MAAEGFSHGEILATKADPAPVVYFPCGRSAGVLNRRQILREFPVAGLVARGRRGHIQVLMGTDRVIAGPPVGHPGVGFVVVGELPVVEQLIIQGSVKALVFCLCPAGGSAGRR